MCNCIRISLRLFTNLLRRGIDETIDFFTSNCKQINDDDIVCDECILEISPNTIYGKCTSIFFIYLYLNL